MLLSQDHGLWGSGFQCESLYYNYFTDNNYKWVNRHQAGTVGKQNKNTKQWI